MRVAIFANELRLRYTRRALSPRVEILRQRYTEPRHVGLRLEDLGGGLREIAQVDPRRVLAQGFQYGLAGRANRVVAPDRVGKRVVARRGNGHRRLPFLPLNVLGNAIVLELLQVD